MKLQKIFDRIFYYPFESETDRPALIYVQGDRFSLVVDAGNSKKHVDEFYKELIDNDLRLPDFTLITHWHWDHTFGMKYVNGVTFALDETNKYLRKARDNFENSEFVEKVRRENEYFRIEYGDEMTFEIVESDISFNDKVTIDLGGVSIYAEKIVNPHTDDHILIHIPNYRLLILGDSTGEDSFNFGFGKFFMDGLMDKDLLKSLYDTIDSIDCDTCILSHVDIVSKEELLNEMRILLEN